MTGAAEASSAWPRCLSLAFTSRFNRDSINGEVQRLRRKAHRMPVNNDNNDNHTIENVDDLDAYIAERDKREPGFAAQVEEKLRQRREARARGKGPDAAAWEESDTSEQPATPNAKP